MSDFSQSSIITLALVSKWLAEQVGNSSVSAEARESLEVAHQCISEVLSSPSMPSADATIKSVAALNLETVVLEGLKALNGSKNQSEEKSVTEDESKGKFSPKFLQYMQKLETSGYFQGVEVNSVEYQSRVAKALEKWNAKHGSAYVDTPSNKVQTSKDDSKVISEEEKKRAEMFKSDGNQKLSAGDVNGAIESYSKAIELNPEVAIFYGNR